MGRLGLSILVLCLGLANITNASGSSLLEEFRKEMEQLKVTTANEMKSLRADMENLKVENEKLKKDHVSRRFVLTNPFAEKPAFSAALTQHAMGLGNNQPIVFDKAFTNDLRAYSPITGVFTVPMNGTYFFTATVMSHAGEYLETEICLNGQRMVLMYSHDTSHEQGTNSVVLALKMGDSVWVRHTTTQGTNVYGGNWSTFSGFLI